MWMSRHTPESDKGVQACTIILMFEGLILILRYLVCNQICSVGHCREIVVAELTPGVVAAKMNTFYMLTFRGLQEVLEYSEVIVSAICGFRAWLNFSNRPRILLMPSKR